MPSAGVTDSDDRRTAEIERLCRVAGGASFGQLMAHTNLPQPRLYDLLGQMMASGRLERRGGVFVSAAASKRPRSSLRRST